MVRPTARVLALLALRVGSPVSALDLEWALWGDDETKTAVKAIQGYVSALRQLLPDDAFRQAPVGTEPWMLPAGMSARSPA